MLRLVDQSYSLHCLNLYRKMRASTWNNIRAVSLAAVYGLELNNEHIIKSHPKSACTEKVDVVACSCLMKVISGVWTGGNSVSRKSSLRSKQMNVYLRWPAPHLSSTELAPDCHWSWRWTGS
mmetsp:Transcript_43335/g.76791  ORF Transcript_43335/g.76791 Transcript_43335/m.76791 type:complete len:122 (-) Transcript_43335:236-601(-)